MHIVREGFFAFLEGAANPGDGFGLFGRQHLAVLAGLALLAALLCFVYIQLTYTERPVMLKALAWFIFGMELFKQATFPFLHGGYLATQLPLHLCGLSIFLQLIYAYYADLAIGKAVGEILYALCLPGAVAALVFANWSMYPIINYYSIHSFLIHTLHVAFTMMLLLSGELRPSARGLWKPAVFLLITVPPVYVLNGRLGTNFFFVNAGSPGSPLDLFINMFGVPWFLLPYAGLVLVLWFLMYLPWELFRHQSRKYKVKVYSRY